jgi:hypothetical protein
MANTKAKWVNGRLTFYNAPIEMSTGCYLVDENVYSQSSAGATLKNYGVQILVASTVVSTIPAPENGSIVDLLFYGTTKTMCVKTTGLLFNRQAKQDVFTVDLSTAASKAIGHHVRLIGEGTSGWYLLTSMGMQSSKLTNVVALTSDVP